MISVKNNLPAVNAANQLTFNKRKSSKITEKLSSGYRINRAADDAAGLQNPCAYKSAAFTVLPKIFRKEPR